MVKLGNEDQKTVNTPLATRQPVVLSSRKLDFRPKLPDNSGKLPWIQLPGRSCWVMRSQNSVLAYPIFDFKSFHRNRPTLKGNMVVNNLAGFYNRQTTKIIGIVQADF